MNPARVMQPAAEDPVQKIGFFLLSLYFFLTYSRILDITVPSLHIPLIVGVGLYGAAALAGSIQRALATTVGKLLIALTGIMALSALFGAWQGGSFKVLTESWFKAFPFYIAIVGLCPTTNHILRFMRAVCWAVGLLAVIALWRGDALLGRLMIENSRFADPNDLALVCLIGLPFACFLMGRPLPFFRKIAPFGIGLILLYAISRTGSRGAMLGLAAGLAYLFWRVSLANKFKMALGIFVVVFAAAAILPPEVYLRYAGMVNETANDTDEAGAAEGSAEARLHLLTESIWMTLKHPLLGVGPGNFSVVENEVAQSKGYRRGSWHETHNMYTQISSENGIPAGIIFVSILVLSLKASGRAAKLARKHPNEAAVSNAALWLRTSLIIYAVTGFFLTVGYSDFLPLLCGLAVAYELAVRNEVRLQAAAAAPVIQPVPVLAGVRR